MPTTGLLWWALVVSYDQLYLCGPGPTSAFRCMPVLGEDPRAICRAGPSGSSCRPELRTHSDLACNSLRVRSATRRLRAIVIAGGDSICIAAIDGEGIALRVIPN